MPLRNEAMGGMQSMQICGLLNRQCGDGVFDQLQRDLKVF